MKLHTPFSIVCLLILFFFSPFFVKKKKFYHFFYISLFFSLPSHSIPSYSFHPICICLHSPAYFNTFTFNIVHCGCVLYDDFSEYIHIGTLTTTKKPSDAPKYSITRRDRVFFPQLCSFFLSSLCVYTICWLYLKTLTLLCCFKLLTRRSVCVLFFLFIHLWPQTMLVTCLCFVLFSRSHNLFQM